MCIWTRQPSSLSRSTLSRSAGFTLLELMISLSIIVIILTMGVPSLQETLIRSRVDNFIYDLSKDILLARNHAIQYESQTVMCHLNNSNQCDGKWDAGYSLFLDENRDEIYQADTDKLIIQRVHHNSSDIILFSGSKELKYDADGHLNGLSGTFRYCPDIENDENYARAIVVSLSGRPRVSRDIDGDGKDETGAAKSHITCKQP